MTAWKTTKDAFLVKFWTWDASLNYLGRLSNQPNLYKGMVLATTKVVILTLSKALNPELLLGD